MQMLVLVSSMTPAAYGNASLVVKVQLRLAPEAGQIGCDIDSLQDQTGTMYGGLQSAALEQWPVIGPTVILALTQVLVNLWC